MRANQNCGIERLKNENPVEMLSNFEYWRRAEMIPRVTPTEMVMMNAKVPSTIVLKSARWRSGHTSRRDESDLPQSNMTNDLSHVQYCMGSDLSSPRLRRYSSSSSGLARGLRASAASGSVEDRTAMKTRMLAIRSVGIAHSARLTTNLVNVHLPFAQR